MSGATEQLRIGILGASGYTGAEAVRLLLRHPRCRLALLTADRHAGKPLAAVFPQFRGVDLPDLIRVEEADWRGIDVVFCALPHGTTQEIIAALPKHLKVIDLSADFRLSDPALYAQWYGQEHRALGLQEEAVYGLTELNRPLLTQARLVANPGCYPTCAQLPLVPLLKAGLIADEDIIINATSGASGAGRAPKEATLFCEVAEGFHAYSVSAHRHTPEMEQELSRHAGRPIQVSFTPHLAPMNRGMLATIAVRLAGAADADALRDCLVEAYRDEPFLRVLAAGDSPHTRHVRGTNLCALATFPDRLPGRALLLSALDNLVKGASGQAVQTLNLMQGWPETLGLEASALFP